MHHDDSSYFGSVDSSDKSCGMDTGKEEGNGGADGDSFYSLLLILGPSSHFH